MIPLFTPGYDFMEGIGQRPTQSAYWCPVVAEGNPLPGYGTAGTGGLVGFVFCAEAADIKQSRPPANKKTRLVHFLKKIFSISDDNFAYIGMIRQ